MTVRKGKRRQSEFARFPLVRLSRDVFRLGLDANDLGEAGGGLGEVGAVRKVRAGALGLARHVADHVAAW